MTSLDSTVSAAVAIVVLALATLYLTRRLFFRQNLPLPPGPKPIPLIGNLLDMPRSNEWECFAEWARRYGDIVHCRIFGRHMVILNSFEAATELLDKRSLIYSDRPLFPMGDLVSMREFNFGFMEYGKEWQIRRRTYTDLFSKSSPQALEPHRAATLHMVKQLFQDPKNWEEHLRLHPAQVMLDVTYGLDIFSRDHPVIRTVEEAMSTVVDVILRPEWWIVNPVHILKGWPTVLGGGFVKLKIEKWRKQFVALREVPWQEGKKSVRPSFITEINGDLAKESKDRQETLLKDCAGVAYGAGVETSYSYSSIFVLTMLLNPSVQKKAQDELDAVIGHSQFPQLTDRPHLPYVNALIKEVIRWHAVLPQGIPHEARQDDIYRGYFIPKGTMVISNIWHILRDPSVYPDPDKFDPERFLQGGTFAVGDNDPSRVAFGFGRRICPGKAFAEDSLFHVVTYILTLFCIEPSEDTPKDSALLRRFSSGATSYALPFSCHFAVRSEEAERFLMS